MPKLHKYKGYLFKTKPWAHQLAALRYLMDKDYAGLYTDCGSGKSKIMLDLIVNRGFKNILIVCTNKACQNRVWETQISLHTYISSTVVLNLSGMSTHEKVRQLKIKPVAGKFAEQTSIVICNYEAIWRQPLADYLVRHAKEFDCVICDESHRIKTPSSKVSRFLVRMGARVPHKYLVTGTPSSESPMDVYAQYKFLNPDIFGTSFTAFKERYQNIDVNATARLGFPVLDKRQPYKNLDELKRLMFSCAFKMDSAVKLPPTQVVDYKFFLDSHTDIIYKQLEKEGAVEYGDEFMTVENVLAGIVRKQQLTSGYLHLEDDDGNTHLKRISTQRRNILMQLLEDIPPTEPVVIFARFKKDLYSIRKVSERMEKSYSELSGREDTLADWQAGKTQIISVQISSGAESIDLTRARYCIYYSMTHSLATYDQSLKRCHRPGQTRPVTYMRIIATSKAVKSTIDEQIVYCLDRKKDVVEYLMQKDRKNS